MLNPYAVMQAHLINYNLSQSLTGLGNPPAPPPFFLFHTVYLGEINQENLICRPLSWVFSSSLLALKHRECVSRSTKQAYQRLHRKEQYSLKFKIDIAHHNTFYHAKEMKLIEKS